MEVAGLQVHRKAWHDGWPIRRDHAIADHGIDASPDATRVRAGGRAAGASHCRHRGRQTPPVRHRAPAHSVAGHRRKVRYRTSGWAASKARTGLGPTPANPHRTAAAPGEQQRLVANLVRPGVRQHPPNVISRAAITPADDARTPGPRCCNWRANHRVSGVLPAPPTVMLPTTTTGTGKRRGLAAARRLAALRARKKPEQRQGKATTPASARRRANGVAIVAVSQRATHQRFWVAKEIADSLPFAPPASQSQRSGASPWHRH